MLKIQLCITGINYIRKYIQIVMFHNIFDKISAAFMKVRDFLNLTDFKQYCILSI